MPIVRSKGQKARPRGVSYQLSKYAHKTTNDWSIILINLRNNTKYRFTKGDWAEASTSFPGSSLFLPRERKREDPGNEVAEALDQAAMFTSDYGQFG